MPMGSGLASVRIANLRNLRRMRLEVDTPVVILTGGNGSGKTTILESIYLLARGRSFRGRKAGPLITRGESEVAIAGICTGVDSSRISLHYRRDPHGSRRSVDRIVWESATHQTFPLTVKLISENAQSLLEGDPTLRRTFLDWNVFHVEHQLARLRKDLHRVLLQRNAALRRGGSGLSHWDRTLVMLAEEIHHARERFFLAWSTAFDRLAQPFDFLSDCQLLYRRGWPEQSSLTEVLGQSRGAEVARGYTLVGPSRADFCIARDLAAVTLSRGQTKVAVCLLQLAADQVHRDHGLARSVWLLDDLEAELDQGMASRVWGLFRESQSPCLVTRASNRPDPGVFVQGGETAMFHVEHGCLVSQHRLDRSGG